MMAAPSLPCPPPSVSVRNATTVKRERQPHGAGLGKIKARGRNIEPQKRQEAAGYRRAERRDVHLCLKERDARVRAEDSGEDAAREAVDAVDDAAGIYKERDEDKKRDKP